MRSTRSGFFSHKIRSNRKKNDTPDKDCLPGVGPSDPAGANSDLSESGSETGPSIVVFDQSDLPEAELAESYLEELIKLGELKIIDQIIFFLKTLSDRKIPHQETCDAIVFALEVVTLAGGKLKEAEGLNVYNAWGLIQDFKTNQELYVGNTHKVAEMFGKIQVTENTAIIWNALALRIQALHDNTANHLIEEGQDKPIKKNGSYPTLDKGDAFFRWMTGVCKYDLIASYATVAERIRSAVEAHKNSRQLAEPEDGFDEAAPNRYKFA